MGNEVLWSDDKITQTIFNPPDTITYLKAIAEQERRESINKDFRKNEDVPSSASDTNSSIGLIAAIGIGCAVLAPVLPYIVFGGIVGGVLYGAYSIYEKISDKKESRKNRIKTEKHHVYPYDFSLRKAKSCEKFSLRTVFSPYKIIAYNHAHKIKDAVISASGKENNIPSYDIGINKYNDIVYKIKKSIDKTYPVTSPVLYHSVLGKTNIMNRFLKKRKLRKEQKNEIRNAVDFIDNMKSILSSENQISSFYNIIVEFADKKAGDAFDQYQAAKTLPEKEIPKHFGFSARIYNDTLEIEKDAYLARHDSAVKDYETYKAEKSKSVKLFNDNKKLLISEQKRFTTYVQHVEKMNPDIVTKFRSDIDEALSVIDTALSNDAQAIIAAGRKQLAEINKSHEKIKPAVQDAAVSAPAVSEPVAVNDTAPTRKTIRLNIPDIKTDIDFDFLVSNSVIPVSNKPDKQNGLTPT